MDAKEAMNKYLQVKDAALALCSLGNGTSDTDDSDCENKHQRPNPTSSTSANIIVTSPAYGLTANKTMSNVTPRSSPEDNCCVLTCSFCPTSSLEAQFRRNELLNININNSSASPVSSSPQSASNEGKTAVVRRTYKKKASDPIRDTSVSHDEMVRLMRVYGPVKCLRNRTPKEKALKADSIRRKFYRWFPEFGDRFEKTVEGWYKPKIGHTEEIEYREEMRKLDQQVLAKKRLASRFNLETMENPMSNFNSKLV
ncbi:predicted protein [Thalassiosira pseudonana CCMP1335]|uniref:Uncharacterized protein n=1 Tax=Thalassiosira pseudonana TaxID=35128 RepID=B8BQ85_THAPS|nr:predicted protein [Thalassiosira pseudonana CCMP1335]EED96321.1 predicted protein [Thalassiosira pseudonana CCMP1335]